MAKTCTWKIHKKDNARNPSMAAIVAPMAATEAPGLHPDGNKAGRKELLFSQPPAVPHRWRSEHNGREPLANSIPSSGLSTFRGRWLTWLWYVYLGDPLFACGCVSVLSLLLAGFKLSVCLVCAVRMASFGSSSKRLLSSQRRFTRSYLLMTMVRPECALFHTTPHLCLTASSLEQSFHTNAKRLATRNANERR